VVSWVRLKLEQAGLTNSAKFKFGSVLFPIIVFVIFQDIFQIWLLSFSATVATIALGLEYLGSKARSRVRLIHDEWTTVLESLESAAQSSMPLLDSLRDLGESTNLVVARDFAYACNLCDRGESLDMALQSLKPRFGLAICDSTVETLRVVNESGGAGFVAALRNQAKAIRDDSAVFQQIAAKQGWVRGTAKVAVAAPWVIVILLASRPENAQAYSSAQGSLLLFGGLVASVMAIRLISLIGGFDEQRRVLA
jgi:tight adherence protein B